MDKDIVKKVVQFCEKYDRKLYGVVSNMSIAMERRDLLQKFDCFICNQQEAGMFFSDDYSEKSQEELQEILADCLKNGNIPSMVVTMGGKGSVYADCEGLRGFCPPKNVSVKDTTGAGDIMLNIQSLIKFPIPLNQTISICESINVVNQSIYQTYGFTSDEISYIESSI